MRAVPVVGRDEVEWVPATPPPRRHEAWARFRRNRLAWPALQ